MAWETQGAIYDRTKSTWALRIPGFAMFRQMLKEQIELVADGGDPIALVTDPAKNENIDMWAQYLGVQGGKPTAPTGGRAPRGVPFDRVFDESHVVYESVRYRPPRARELSRRPDGQRAHARSEEPTMLTQQENDELTRVGRGTPAASCCAATGIRSPWRRS